METEKNKYICGYTGPNEIVRKLCVHFDGQEIDLSVKSILDLAESGDEETIKSLTDLREKLIQDINQTTLTPTQTPTPSGMYTTQTPHGPRSTHGPHATHGSPVLKNATKEIGKLTANALLHGVSSSLIKGLLHIKP